MKTKHYRPRSTARQRGALAGSLGGFLGLAVAGVLTLLWLQNSSGADAGTVDADRILAEFVETLLQYSDAKILVKGFVSSNNDTLENTQLSEKRAISVQKLLMNRGIPEAQIEIRGMGIQDPIATNDTPAGRLKNRRVEIEVIDDGV